MAATSFVPGTHSISGAFFMFQQCNAPAHYARKTVTLQLSANTPNFIGLQYQPPNSPDLNPVDYTIWGKTECIIA